MRRVSDQLGSRRVATIGVPAMFLHGTEILGLFIYVLVVTSSMLIGRPIAILYFLARKITAEDSGVCRVLLTVCFLSASLCARYS